MEDLALTLIHQYGLIGLLISNIIAYSIIPFPSEAAMIAATFFFDPIVVVVISLIGSTIGNLTDYYIGKKGLRLYLKKTYTKKESRWKIKAKKLFDKYGALSILLFVNFPLIGDPLVIVAGSFNMKLWKFLLYSTISKTIYFIIIVSIGVGLENLII